MEGKRNNNACRRCRWEFVGEVVIIHTCDTPKASLMGAVTLVRDDVEGPMTADISNVGGDVSSVT